MEFAIEKYATLIMKSVKRQMTEENELPTQEKNQNAWREGKFHILGKNF